MNKKTAKWIGITMLLIAVVYSLVVHVHPGMSITWGYWFTDLLYVIYVAIMLVMIFSPF